MFQSEPYILKPLQRVLYLHRVLFSVAKGIQFKIKESKQRKRVLSMKESRRTNHAFSLNQRPSIPEYQGNGFRVHESESLRITDPGFRR